MNVGALAARASVRLLFYVPMRRCGQGKDVFFVPFKVAIAACRALVDRVIVRFPTGGTDVVAGALRAASRLL